MQYYQQLLACSSNSSSGPNSSSTAAKFVPADKSTKPVRDAYFACLEDTIKCCRTAADHLRPAGTAASTGSSSTVPGMSSSSRSKPSSAYDPLLVDSDDEDSTASNAAAATPDSAAAAGAALRPRQLSDDVRLLLLASNLAFMRSRLVGSLTQRFLLVLTGEVASELERCSRYVVKLAGRLDTAVQVCGLHSATSQKNSSHCSIHPSAKTAMIAAHVQPPRPVALLQPQSRGVGLAIRSCTPREQGLLAEDRLSHICIYKLLLQKTRCRLSSCSC